MSRLKKPFLIFMRYYRNLGVRVTFYALLSLLAATLSGVVTPIFPVGFVEQLGFSSVLPVLGILASSMLAVSTFSLNVMVVAHQAAAGTTTPRVHRILLEDTTTQSVLSAFIGAFVFSLSTIVLYHTGFYDADAAVVVMMMTIAVAVIVVISILRWIEHLKSLGSVDNSLATVTSRARSSLQYAARDPVFGATPLTDDTLLPQVTSAVRAPRTGYLQLVDVGKLHQVLPKGAIIYIEVRPGIHVLEGELIARVAGAVDDDCKKKLVAAFTFGSERTPEQDAEFGLIVLSETASRALSPGINDPGTAIEAILRLKSLLWEFSRTSPENADSRVQNVFVRAVDPERLMQAAYAPIARDAAGTIEVALNLRRAFQALVVCGDPAMAAASRDMAALALAYSERALPLEGEISRLAAIDMGTPGTPEGDKKKGPE